MQKGPTAEDVIKKVKGEERVGSIKKIKEADAAATLGALFDWMEDSGEFNKSSGSDRWQFVDRVFSRFENGNVQETPWYLKMY
jgi:nuclear transport factor 2 (NTF2) superfamily protein